MITFFGIGVYGGFIQAGVGIFLLAGLVLSAGLRSGASQRRQGADNLMLSPPSH